MDISIIIVNWNTRDLLINCIDAVYKTIGNLTFTIWIVDNGSTDGSVELLQSRYPQVKIIENRQNVGFARANNQALRQMNGRYGVLLNTDTILVNGSIEKIVQYMDNDTEVGICGGQLLYTDSSRQNSIANIPTLATELLNKSLLRRLFPQKYPGKSVKFAAPVEVESIIGACLVVRKKAMDQVGLLDENYFFFLEETDWCLRMRKNGWKVVHHPGVTIYHLRGQTADKMSIRARIEYWNSRYIFFETHYPKAPVFILKTGLLVKLFIEFLLTVSLNILCFFMNKRARRKSYRYARLIDWHLKGKPVEYGLRGV